MRIITQLAQQHKGILSSLTSEDQKHALHLVSAVWREEPEVIRVGAEGENPKLPITPFTVSNPHSHHEFLGQGSLHPHQTSTIFT